MIDIRERFAQELRSMMRQKRVTVRELARCMAVPMARVREVRKHGRPPFFWKAPTHGWFQDWREGVARAAAAKASGNTTPQQ